MIVFRIEGPDGKGPWTSSAPDGAHAHDELARAAGIATTANGHPGPNRDPGLRHLSISHFSDCPYLFAFACRAQMLKWFACEEGRERMDRAGYRLVELQVPDEDCVVGLEQVVFLRRSAVERARWSVGRPDEPAGYEPERRVPEEPERVSLGVAPTTLKDVRLSFPSLRPGGVVRTAADQERLERSFVSRETERMAQAFTRGYRMRQQGLVENRIQAMGYDELNQVVVGRGEFTADGGVACYFEDGYSAKRTAAEREDDASKLREAMSGVPAWVGGETLGPERYRKD